MSDDLLEHSPRGPSGFHRWAYCLGSAEAERGLADKTSKWAAEGTLFHQLVADLLVDPYLRAESFLGLKEVVDGIEIECDQDMAKHLHNTAELIYAMPGRRFVEKRVYLHRWMDSEFGTTDVGILSREWITIVDHKYGMIPHNAFKHEQSMLYGLGFWDWLRKREDISHIKKFRFVINQPRIADGGGEPWETTLDELLEFGDRVRKLYVESLKKGNPRTPGLKICQWCKAKPTCKEYQDFAVDIAGLKMEAASTALTIVRPLTPEQRSYVLLNWPLVVKWHELLHAQALDDALGGLPVPGMKAILGRRGSRVWIDEAEAEKALAPLIGDAAIVRSVISPTKAEEALTIEEYATLKKLVMQADPKPVLVAETAAGIPVKTVDDKFSSLEKSNGHQDKFKCGNNTAKTAALLPKPVQSETVRRARRGS